ncbi:lytic transglycosylase domain-containing protein [Desulfopila sp. IMCC35006]|uniref:lytic transglycosylase domain-containing protein n=1 Tax=Desulfopila sp. IMCC35006 TaxID=2569542 RepID=UPI001F0F4D05|nr:lytic transglycosylase domain-containing protein [Desulfopila sp. IMCC35006]
MAGALNTFISGRESAPDQAHASGHGIGFPFFRARLYSTCLRFGVYAMLLLVLLVFDSNTVQAEMYLCTDASGTTNFTNVPNSPDCKAVELKKDVNWANLPSRSTRSYPSYSSGGSDSARYDREIIRIGRLYNVDPPLIKAIIHTESAFDSEAVSHCGAQGLMQLMPGTASDLQVDNPFNALENIEGGTRYFRSLLDSFNEDLILSLAAYNAGPGLVSRTGGVPLIPETVQYINRVLKRYKVYKANW